MNTGVAWNSVSEAGGLEWILQDHLNHVYLAGIKLITSRNEAKTLEAMLNYLMMESVSQILHSTHLVEFDCVELINLLNNIVGDITKVSFFIDKN